jgi:hypothetical protein
LTLGVTKDKVTSRSTGVKLDVLDDSSGPNSTFLLVVKFKQGPAGLHWSRQRTAMKQTITQNT